VRIKIDAYLGERNFLDFSFFEKRESWLASTGLYIEFILKGMCSEAIRFDVESEDAGAIKVCQHSWNRFFLNIERSAKVYFRVFEGKEKKVERSLNMKVEDIDSLLLFSVPHLLDFDVPDIRFFSNRLSERMVNGTRVTLFSSKFLSRLSGIGWDTGDASLWKFFDVVFSIITERGIRLVVTPFDNKAVYTDEIIQGLKRLLFVFIERYSKFKIIWDFSQGLPARYSDIIFDGILNKFKTASLVLPESLKDRLGSFTSYYQRIFSDGRLNGITVNEEGMKILFIYPFSEDFYKMREFVRESVKNNWSVECVYENVRSLTQLKYSVARALFLGYSDAKSGVRNV